jgi:rRNA maturation endonuclease Nob1
MGHNFKETSVNNINKQVYDKNFDDIFGKTIICEKCGKKFNSKDPEKDLCLYCEKELEL